MDVDRISFFPLLLDILEDISQSHFVAFDLELSGVPTKQDRQKGRAGKPTIQERYVEIKQAAEKFHILQFGLTCVVEDASEGKYCCKPYNIDLSSLIDDIGLGIERQFSFSSGAVSFLQSVQFDFNKPFSSGVRYLTNQEIEQAREGFEARQKRDAVPDMVLKETDVEALALCASTRKTIDAWLAKSTQTADFWVSIGPPGFDKPASSPDDYPPEFNRYQKRIVHQLVRAEYPQLVSYSKHGFIQVQRLNEKREARLLAERRAEFDKRLIKQKGFSWVMDAVLGTISGPFDISLCGYHPVTGSAVMIDTDVLQARFNAVTSKLRERSRTVVGHNCFLDLVYIYHTFVGSLPDTVEGFKRAIHEKWPCIIDTKYMATHNCGDINPASSLEEIARQLRPQPGQESLDMLDPEHNKYDEVEQFHEAGFDSLLTAQIAIRLSAKLEQEGAYMQDLENDLGGVSLSGEKHSSSISTVVGKTKSVVGATLSSLGLKSSGANRYAVLDGAEEQQHIENGMPAFNSDFWKVYGNNLRVFGTEEGLLSLD